MISLIWTRRPILGSWLIRKITKGEASHFSLVFDEKVVFESTMNCGCKLSFFNEFKRTHEIVYRLNFDFGLKKEEEIWQICSDMYPMPYDYFGAINLAIWCLFKRWRDPSYENNSALDCVEVAGALRPVFDIPKELSLTTPDELYLLFVDKKEALA